MIWSNSETAFPNIKYKLSTRALKTDHDHAYSHSIRQRTKYRYSAELKVRGTKMTIVDKVTGLVNGDLELEDVGVKLDDEMVKFKLDVNQITAVWISRDLIVMRFCWGMTYRSAWDVIIDRSKFVVGTDVDFIKFLKKNLKGKRITNNYLKFVNHPEKFRLGNYSTDTKTPFFTQRRVKIYHNFWGPFKKRGRKSKDKEIKK